ncbi:MAG: CRTAC1 family protein, partial [bacterium]
GLRIAQASLVEGERHTGARDLFVNVAHEAGIDFLNRYYPPFLTEPLRFGMIRHGPGGIAVADVDNDGFQDLFIPDGVESRLFRNRGLDASGQPAFEDVTAAWGLSGLDGVSVGTFADYDNDGWKDVFVSRTFQPNQLFHNDGPDAAGNLRFRDVTAASGIGADCCTTVASWADYDNDGDLDLYVGNESDPEVRAPCQLFRNEGGKFTDVARAAGLAEMLFAMGAVWGDYDGDRLPDLFVSAGGPNRLYRNLGDGTFRDVAAEAGVTSPAASFSTWWWDFDDDGALDLWVGASTGSVGLVTRRALGLPLVSGDSTAVRFSRETTSALGFRRTFELSCLYEGDGRGRFEDVASAMGIGYPTQPMGANFGDLDQDGRLDFYLGEGDLPYSELRPNRMFVRRGGRFVDVTMAGAFGHLHQGHGVAFADLDHDGDEDVWVRLGGAVPDDPSYDALFENPGFGNRWITVKLEGRESNRSAIGARIRAEFTDGGETRSVWRWVSSGGSFGANPLRQTIGLGKAESIDVLEVYWPTTDRTQTFRNVAVDHAIEIVEGKDEIREIRVKPFSFRASPRAPTGPRDARSRS